MKTRPLWLSLPRTVLVLGLVSLLTDLSSEMIYPLLPVFLAAELGAGALALGLIEGLAESTAAALKIVSGLWTDRTRRRRPFLLAGYGLSGAVRPLIGLATSVPFVVALRFFDRVGKGLRSSPRDALIADVTDPARRGLAYGVHRSMDHAGAVVGPLVAAALLGWAGFGIRDVFLAAAVPAALTLLVILVGVREPRREPVEPTPPAGTGAAIPPVPPVSAAGRGGGAGLGREFKILLGAVLVFTFGRPTDVFLVKRLADAEVASATLVTLWSALHVIKMTATYYGGKLVDRVGPRLPLAAGWMLHAVLYSALAYTEGTEALLFLFLAYGFVFGLAEPAERAWVAQLVPPHLRGTAFGYYHGAVGVAALPAGLLFGWIWSELGLAPAFLLGAALGGAAALLLCLSPAGAGATMPSRPR